MGIALRIVGGLLAAVGLYFVGLVAADGDSVHILWLLPLTVFVSVPCFLLAHLWENVKQLHNVQVTELYDRIDELKKRVAALEADAK